MEEIPEVDLLLKPSKKAYELTENDKELLAFVVDHTDRWRDYRDQNHLDDWERYERIFRGKWESTDKYRESERSRVISPATQQAIETRHAEVMEAIFGQGEFFDIEDDILDINGSKLDVEKLKNQLKEDFARDKIRKSIDQIELMAEIYGTGIGEVVVGKEKTYTPAMMPVNSNETAYGVTEDDRVFIKLNPVNPKNFLFDPNGTSIDDCMGVAIERYTSIHKIVNGIAKGKYLNVDIDSLYKTDDLEPTQETVNYQDDKVLLLTYYGLVPREYLADAEEEDVELFTENLGESVEDYADMVEAIIVIANGSLLLKAEESPYTMKDRPVLSYQDDTVPNRLLGRGTAEKAFNMQASIDSSMRLYLDGLALTSVPMMGMDATRLPRGAKFKVQPGGNFLTNGNPNEILMPFKFGMSDGAAMETSKEFERMLLMATGTVDSQGMVSQVSRDGNMDMATATMIKKYKRTLVNFQEDFLIPFIYKAMWRYMQFDPKRYPSVDVKFIPTATLGIIAREYEQKQLAFLIQTLGAESPLTPILMKGVVSQSSASNKEEMLAQMDKASQPDPQKQQMDMQMMQKDMEAKQASIDKDKAIAGYNMAMANKANIEAQLYPEKVKSDIISALSRNLPDEDAAAKNEFDRRERIAKLMLQEEAMDNDKEIVRMQMANKTKE